MRRNQYIPLSLVLFILLGGGLLLGADLWRDHNPYSPFEALRAGTILKLVIDEPIVVEYEYEGEGDDKVKVKMVPDKGLSEFLPAANVSKSIQDKKKALVRARGRVKINLAVTVQSIANGTALISGTKVLAYESGKAVQQMQLTGRVSIRDINRSRMIRSRDVAELQLVIQGAPQKQSRNLPMKTTGNPPRPSAALTENEKQRLILEYLNRIFGETSDR